MPATLLSGAGSLITSCAIAVRHDRAITAEIINFFIVPMFFKLCYNRVCEVKIRISVERKDILTKTLRLFSGLAFIFGFVEYFILRARNHPLNTFKASIP